MKRVIVLSVLAVCITTVAIAQKDGKTRFSAGVELGLATGDFSEGWSLGLGVSGQAEHFFEESISGVANIGFISYLGKSVGGGLKNKAINVIPVKVGGRYYIGDGFHLGAQIGVGFFSGGSSSSTAFAYSPQIGYNFKTNKDKSIDATLKYDGYSKSGGTLGSVGIRVALIF